MIDNLSKMLCDVTGYDSISMQSNSGAQGEYAGLLTIGRYHKSRGDNNRDICLIPMSAHGTNPATAVTCGYTVRTIDTKGTGRLTVEAFKEALGDGKDVAGMMVTNPNTCGLFEREILEIVDLLHKAGGYFYCDGANFNALVGSIRPGDFGGGNDRGVVQVAFGGRRRADAHGMVGQAHVHGIGIGGGVHRHGLDPHFVRGAVDAQRDFTAIGDQDAGNAHG